MAQELGDPVVGDGRCRRPRREPTAGTTAMNGDGKSDRPIVPKKPPNKGGAAASSAEGVEGRGLAKENPLQRDQSIGPRAALTGKARWRGYGRREHRLRVIIRGKSPVR